MRKDMAMKYLPVLFMLRGAIEVKITEAERSNISSKNYPSRPKVHKVKNHHHKLFIEKFEGTYVKGNVLLVVALMMFRAPSFLT